MSEREKLQILSDVTLFVLGWLMGKCEGEGLDAWQAPILPLVQALKAIGVECDFVDAILKCAAAYDATKGSAP